MSDIKTRNLCFQIEKNDNAVIYFSAEDGSDISCMIDTGANVPIWFMGEKFMRLHFPSAVKTDKLTIIHGLGKEPLMDVPVWSIPLFIIKDDSGESIVFHDFLILVVEASKFLFNMLIPLTILNRVRFSFDYTQSAKYGYFEINSDKENYYIRPVFVPNNDKYLNKIQAFVQDEI